MASLAFPNESHAYREARDRLLQAEIALRRQIENVAEQRRALPQGGAVPEDYVFEWIGPHLRPEPVRMSELFGGHPTLILYSFMYGPDRDQPCPGCTHLLDGLDGAARHVGARTNLFIVAKSPIARLSALAHRRGWAHLKFLSTAGNSYAADYFGDTSQLSAEMRRSHAVPDGKNWDETIFNVFERDGSIIRHVWASELAYQPSEPGQHHRAGDLVDPLWGLLDMTREGRGDFFPSVGD
ncbi:DUF899 family protein [Jiella pacifica]|uniref:DUF899 domain-containing protein n=1 Tax=Jiella pacifica TaxID=2696469 RepID=A0A6N9TDY9_9HYPH|nr:DUF899 family protein [Jiella pacifica]NDW07889.1 DUF899 domain-containing protein [Jiella pacifica]